MYKEDLALNNVQWLICQKSQPNQIKRKLSMCVCPRTPQQWRVYEDQPDYFPLSVEF